MGRKYTAQERESQISQLCEGTIYSFVRWVDGYSNPKSRFICACEKHGDKYDYSKVIYAGNKTKVTIRCHQHGDFKQTPANHLSGQGCPGCAQSGFDQTKPATMYAIRSDCGQYVKIGITNNFKRRFRKLKHVTPFDVSVIERIECDGQTARQFEKMFHDKFESAGFTGFNGATEWLRWSTELQYWLRLLK